MQEFIKEKRERLDAVIQKIDQLDGSREIALAKTATQRGLMFSGKMLGVLKDDYPYPESLNASNDKIDPRADTFKVAIEYPNEVTSEIQRIKHLRVLIKDIVDGLDEVSSDLSELNIPGGDTVEFGKFLRYFENAISSIEEGGMWLGMQLNNFRELSK